MEKMITYSSTGVIPSNDTFLRLFPCDAASAICSSGVTSNCASSNGGGIVSSCSGRASSCCLLGNYTVTETSISGERHQAKILCLATRARRASGHYNGELLGSSR
jgi:hypothetical protein